MKLLPGDPKPKPASRVKFHPYFHHDPLENPVFRAGYERAKAEDEHQIANLLARIDVLDARITEYQQCKPIAGTNSPRKKRRLF